MESLIFHKVSINHQVGCLPPSSCDVEEYRVFPCARLARLFWHRLDFAATFFGRKKIPKTANHNKKNSVLIRFNLFLQKQETTEQDQHAQAIFRSVVLCLGMTSHHFESSSQLSHSGTIADIIHHQLSAAKENSAECKPVLIAAYTDQVCLQSSDHSVTTTINVEQIVQCSLLHENKAYFAMLAKKSESENWAHCYVFMVDQAWSTSHWTHSKIAKRFAITCTVDPITSNCLEFPGKTLKNWLSSSTQTLEARGRKPDP